MRKTRAGMPATVPSRSDMKGKAALSRSEYRSVSSPSRRRARGPLMATVGPLLGDGGAIDLHVRPFALQPALEPAQHARGIAGGGGHQEMMFVEARGHAVVEDHAVLAAHQAVAAAADLQLGQGVGVDHVEELDRVRALDVDLAQGRGVDDADGGAHRLGLAIDRVMHALAGLGVVPGAAPLADILEGRADALMPADASACGGWGRADRHDPRRRRCRWMTGV